MPGEELMFCIGPRLLRTGTEMTESQRSASGNF